MKIAAYFGLLTALVAATVSAADLESWRRTEFNRARSFQNLAFVPDSDNDDGRRYQGLFLAADEEGRVKVTSRSLLSYPDNAIDLRVPAEYRKPTPEIGMPNMQTWWQVKMVTKKRDHLAHVIMNRGNTKYNGYYLALDPRTGDVVMSKRETANCYWLVRYAGKYRGWDSFYVQSNAETQGVTDMKFLAVDEKSGEMIITADPLRSMNWLVQFAPDLPSETKHY